MAKTPMSRDGWTYTLKRVKCGKGKCGKCPHGPYVYASRKIEGKIKTVYVGQILVIPGTKEEDYLRLMTFFDGAERTEKLAREILGITPKMDIRDWHEAHRKKAAEVKSYKQATEINHRLVALAWDFLCDVMKGGPKRKARGKRALDKKRPFDTTRQPEMF